MAAFHFLKQKASPHRVKAFRKRMPARSGKPTEFSPKTTVVFSPSEYVRDLQIASKGGNGAFAEVAITIAANANGRVATGTLRLEELTAFDARRYRLCLQTTRCLSTARSRAPNLSRFRLRLHHANGLAGALELHFALWRVNKFGRLHHKGTTGDDAGHFAAHPLEQTAGFHPDPLA